MSKEYRCVIFPSFYALFTLFCFDGFVTKCITNLGFLHNADMRLIIVLTESSSIFGT